VPKIKHGCARRGEMTPEYSTWSLMIQRCEDPSSDRYGYYGGRGISVCPKWRTSFAAFLEDVGPKPSPAHSLDRIDPNGNYEPGNVRWATKKEQARNRRTNRLLTVNGETRCLSEWSEITGIPKTTLRLRLERGWPPERAVGRVEDGKAG